MKLQPDSEEALSSLAYLYTEEGDPNKGVHLLEDVPDTGRSSRLYAALGYTYEQAHDYKKAIDAYKRSVELDRENLDSVRGLAQNLLNDGQTDAALEQYRLIADADPQDAQAQLRIAEILRTTGKFDQALEHLKKAWDAGYVNLDWAARDPDLACLHDDPEFQRLIGSSA